MERPYNGMEADHSIALARVLHIPRGASAVTSAVTSPYVPSVISLACKMVHRAASYFGTTGASPSVVFALREV